MAERISPEASTEAPKKPYALVKQPREDRNHPSDRSETEGYANANFIKQPLDKDHEELIKLLKSLPRDEMGGSSIGSDGVLRTLTADRDVLGAVGLPPRLLKAMLDCLPYNKEVEDKFQGVDGSLVPREQWFHPDKSLLPAPMTEEEKEESRKFGEENKEVLAKRKAELEQKDRHIIISNYDLGLK
ncbi:hypothetical protein EYZ11_010562 [Aspergillus tanneri]|uniref:Uncharacterized protein n=1 Tax=Aspergillus tanneri TaxID=1220188 RepID=A0A4S3J776_9EURO|nr:uncharacterized protein ATNIH1004_006533 [Aspergillus tanneri]KAA8647831.1 hypothetical protein ATNIH1004_006533 [Aspergillus tanneri]THC89988.1 hypothetical protein EYZ11_010562 [Aspergillus tanneri]